MKAAAIYSAPPAAGLLTRLRKILSQLPDVTETVSFGHPTFQVAGKTFSVFEQYKGELGLALKVEKELQPVFLKDPRFYMTPYIGKHGWVTLRAPAAKPPCGDLCFVWDGTAAALKAMLDRVGAKIVEGPVARQGGKRAAGMSTYIRDPDGNLLEFIIYS